MKKTEDRKTFLNFFVDQMIWRMTEHQVTAFSAQMAYFFLLSIFPFFILLFAILSRLDLTYDFFYSAAFSVMPQEAMEIIKNYVASLLEVRLETVLPISILASLWTASKAVNALERALNTAYEVDRGRNYLMAKVLGLGITLMLTVVIVLAMTLPSMSRSFLNLLSKHIQISESFKGIFDYGRWVVLTVIFIVVIGSIYTLIPNIKLKFKEVIPGIIFAITGWYGLSFGFSYFLKYFTNFSFVYGSLGAVITLMVWLYFCGMILMMGGEINSILIEYRKIERH